MTGYSTLWSFFVMFKWYKLLNYNLLDDPRTESIEVLKMNEILHLAKGYICAYAWIFFNQCILITQHIQAMKICLLNLIIKNRAQEAKLTCSHFEVIPVSKCRCPKSIVLFISKISQLD